MTMSTPLSAAGPGRRRALSRSTWAVCERMEPRRLMALAVISDNLIVNPGAETDSGATDISTIDNPDGWLFLSAGGSQTPFSAVQYGINGLPDQNTEGPDIRGGNFFAGGPNNSDASI